MLRKLLNIFLVFLTLSTYLFLIPGKAYALDFGVDIDRTYSVNDEGDLLHISEERTVSNYSSEYFIPASSKETFTIQNFKEGLDEDELEIKQDSILVTNQYGSSLFYSSELSDDDITVTVSYPGSIRTDQSLIFKLEYDTNELIEKVGKITNIYIPGLSSDYEEYVTDSDSGTVSQISYNTTLIVPDSIGEPSFTLPEPDEITTSSGYKTYTFSTEKLIEKSVWHQIGKDQVYYFKITQPSPQTDFVTPEQLDFISRNQYKLILPRDYSETNQQVFFTNISPTPQEIEIDNDGNVLATFITNATTEEDIVIEGYITVSLNGENGNDISTAQNSTIDAIQDYSDMTKYLEESQYWEVNDEEIQDKAEGLKGETTNILEILHNNYEFIVDSIDYDEFKYGSINQRQGALTTLKGGSSVCMEYSDLLIALSRAQGIPARAAYGYGYDPKVQPDEQEDHQWVQAWIPEYGWLTIDPTWGETGREFIGRDLDHALWYVASHHPNEPSPLEVISLNQNVELEESTIEVIAVESIPNNVDLKTLSELEEEITENDTTINQITRRIQTTAIGRAFIIVAPITIVVVFAIIILGGIIKLTKRAFKKAKS